LDAGVVEGEIQTAKGLDAAVDRRLHVSGFRDVGDGGDRGAAARFDCCDRFVQLFLAACDGNDLRAGRSGSNAGGTADAGAAAATNATFSAR
jgi:hypothetical protein